MEPKHTLNHDSQSARAQAGVAKAQAHLPNNTKGVKRTQKVVAPKQAVPASPLTHAGGNGRAATTRSASQGKSKV